MNRDALGRDWGVVHNCVRTVRGKPGETTLIGVGGAGLWHGDDARGIGEKKMPGEKWEETEGPGGEEEPGEAEKCFSNESVLCNRRPKYWSFSFSISLSNEFRNDFL